MSDLSQPVASMLYKAIISQPARRKSWVTGLEGKQRPLARVGICTVSNLAITFQQMETEAQPHLVATEAGVIRVAACVHTNSRGRVSCGWEESVYCMGILHPG